MLRQVFVMVFVAVVGSQTASGQLNSPQAVPPVVNNGAAGVAPMLPPAPLGSEGLPYAPAPPARLPVRSDDNGVLSRYGLGVTAGEERIWGGVTAGLSAPLGAGTPQAEMGTAPVVPPRTDLGRAFVRPPVVYVPPVPAPRWGPVVGGVSGPLAAISKTIYPHVASPHDPAWVPGISEGGGWPPGTEAARVGGGVGLAAGVPVPNYVGRGIDMSIQPGANTRIGANLVSDHGVWGGRFVESGGEVGAGYGTHLRTRFYVNEGEPAGVALRTPF